MRWKLLAAFGLGLLLPWGTSQAQTKDFLERFATSPEQRTQLLSTLVPKSSDFYFYSSLHYQSQGDLAKVDALLAEWEEQHRYDSRRQQIQYRQWLLKADPSNKAVLEELRKVVGASFHHTQPTRVVKRTHPSRLPADFVDTQRLTQKALQRAYGSISAFHDRALYRLLDLELHDRQRTEILQRFGWSEHPKIPALVAADLAHRDASFGSLTLHQNLLLSQLDALAVIRPSLWREESFVFAYLRKLQPSPDTRWQDDPKALGRYLDRLWAIVGKKLSGPSFDSLKLHVLKHRLLLAQKLGSLDTALLKKFLQIPRNTPYTAESAIRRYQNHGYANVDADFSHVTGLPSGIMETTLLRKVFLDLFSQPKASRRPFLPFLHPDFLRDLWIEARLTSGLSVDRADLQRFPLSRYKALQERVDIDFASTNPTHFGASDEVALDLHLKNVKTLLVKVYLIHAANYYKDKKQEVRTDLALDGLIPHEERVLTFDHAPLRRFKERFSFPSLKNRGVYLIDFIGQGKSSRALIHKGRLRYTVQDSVAGHKITIVDETGLPLDKSSLWMAGQEYTASKDGSILLP